MILDVETTKRYLQITTDDHDALIADLIKPVQDWIVEYCNNKFKNPKVCLKADTIAFASGGSAAITDSGSGFTDAKFHDRMELCIEGSDLNDGIVTVQTKEDGTLTLDPACSLKEEAAGASVTLTMVVWPAALQPIAAKMIAVDMLAEGVSSESIGAYSVTYDFRAKSGYPDRLTAKLAPFRKLGWT